MKTIRVISLLLALSMLFLFCACGSENQPEENGKDKPVYENAEKLTEDFVSALDTKSPDGEFTTAYARFAAELFRLTRQSGKNSTVSPLSAIYALAMTFTGAEGETLSQFLRAFDCKGDIDADKIGACLAYIASGLYRDETAYTDIANSIWVKDAPGVKLNDGFAEKNRRYYQSDIYAAPFDDSTLKAINGWVSANTDGMIKEILEELSEDAVACLVNAVLFDAKWEESYAETGKREFKKADGSTLTVGMMYSDEDTFIRTKTASGFKKYYAGYGYALIAVLPDGTLEDYLETFDGDEIAALLASERSANVSTGMPAFETEQTADLIPVLQKMGITDAFTGAADFSGMFDGLDVFISQVVHKARVEVTAEGTKAAAATAVEMTKGAYMPGEKETVILDRPFLYMIIDTNTNTPMFIGTFEG